MTELIAYRNIQFELQRKDIKNLHISVMPPDGGIRVAAPESMTSTAIRMAIVAKLPWIRKQQRDFEAQARQSKREFVAGESHFVWGRRYRLKIEHTSKKHEAKLFRGSLVLRVAKDTTAENCERVLKTYYQEKLRSQVELKLPEWKERLQLDDVDYIIRTMKTKWGSSKPEAKRIVLNTELAKKPLECLDYVLLHELAHFYERTHNNSFRRILTQHMPGWENVRKKLNAAPLKDEVW